MALGILVLLPTALYITLREDLASYRDTAPEQQVRADDYVDAERASSMGSTDTATTSDTFSSEPVGVSTPVTLSEAEAVPTSTPSEIASALRTTGAMRCTWVDKTSGNEGLALVRDGRVRVQTTDAHDSTTIVLLTGAASYIWLEGSNVGTVVPDEFTGGESLTEYARRSVLEDLLLANPRARCKKQSIAEAHVAVPRDVTFIRLVE